MDQKINSFCPECLSHNLTVIDRSIALVLYECLDCGNQILKQRRVEEMPIGKRLSKDDIKYMVSYFNQTVSGTDSVRIKFLAKKFKVKQKTIIKHLKANNCEVPDRRKFNKPPKLQVQPEPVSSPEQLQEDYAKLGEMKEDLRSRLNDVKKDFEENLPLPSFLSRIRIKITNMEIILE